MSNEPLDAGTSPSPRESPADGRADLFGLFLSTGVFGYFGFFATDWAHERLTSGELLPMIVLFKWTLRLSAIGFGVALLLAFAKRRESELLSGLVGVLGAIAFVAVGAWAMATGLSPGLPPILLLLFAAWNGYGSWASLRAWFGGR